MERFPALYTGQRCQGVQLQFDFQVIFCIIEEYPEVVKKYPEVRKRQQTRTSGCFSAELIGTGPSLQQGQQIPGSLECHLVGSLLRMGADMGRDNDIGQVKER